MKFRLTGFMVCCSVLLLLPACKKDENNPETVTFFKTCQPVLPTGKLSIDTVSGTYTYVTSGGGKITIDSVFIKFTHTNYPNFEVALWGELNVDNLLKLSANHESLNGKHIKDRYDSRRTIIFPDGTKVTMVAEGAILQLLSVSIYDGSESHRINPTCNKLEQSSLDPAIATQLDQAEPDGEAGGFEFSPTGMLFVNYYTEDKAGNKVMNRVLLGELFWDLPNTVKDHYDDPRLAHT